MRLNENQWEFSFQNNFFSKSIFFLKLTAHHARKDAFSRGDRKQAFGGPIQQMDLEPNKEYLAQKQYLWEQLEYLSPCLDKVLKGTGPGIFFWWTLQVN